MEKGGKMESGESKRGVSRRGRSGKEGGIIERERREVGGVGGGKMGEECK